MDITGQILSIAGACIVSAGGIGAIIIGVTKFTSNSIADALSNRYELKLNKELELYKAGVENKIYISKTKFDTEFQLYRQLSKSFTNMTKEVSQLFPSFTKDVRDDYDKYKPQHDRAVDAIILAQDELCASAAFISADLYEKFAEIEKLCKLQLSDFQDFRLRPDAEEYRSDCREAFQETYKRTREINEKFKNLLEIMREYISRLDVIE